MLCSPASGAVWGNFRRTWCWAVHLEVLESCVGFDSRIRAHSLRHGAERLDRRLALYFQGVDLLVIMLCDIVLFYSVASTFQIA